MIQDAPGGFVPRRQATTTLRLSHHAQSTKTLKNTWEYGSPRAHLPKTPIVPTHQSVGFDLLRATQSMSPQLRVAFSTATPRPLSSARWRSSASGG